MFGLSDQSVLVLDAASNEFGFAGRFFTPAEPHFFVSAAAAGAPLTHYTATDPVAIYREPVGACLYCLVHTVSSCC